MHECFSDQSECHCMCHSNPHTVRHCEPCCEKCQYCDGNIQFGRMENHVATHHPEQVQHEPAPGCPTCPYCGIPIVTDDHLATCDQKSLPYAG